VKEKRMRTIIITAALSATTLAHADRGAGELSLAVATGGHLFAGDLELGVADAERQGSPESGFLVGGRIGLRLGSLFSLEGELVFIPTTERMSGESLDVIGFRGQAAVDLLSRGRLRPFLVAGLGGLDLVDTDAPGMESDTDLALHWGGGLGVELSPTLEMRFDLRHLVLPNITESGGSSDLELSAGIAWVFGREPEPAAPLLVALPPPPAPVAPVPRPADLDGDGLVDEIDDCPGEPETPNAYQDDDGCPDRVIVELGGIHFETGSARIATDSATILERAVEILTRHPTLRVEISGHTSEEGSYRRNVELSLARAEAVKAYLAGRGVDARRMTTAGFGPDRPIVENATPEGRARNRRIEFRVLVD
jgi:outer membrane protein OmpA-like peptidoglycan-associated protein